MTGASLLAVIALPACDNDVNDPPLGASGTATFDVSGEGTFRGAFVVSVGPGEEMARFEFSGWDTDPTDIARSITGNFSLSPGGLVRTAMGDTVEYGPLDPWLWIYDNRGSVGLFGGETVRSYQIRDFSYRSDPERRITVSFVGIGTERIDGTTRTILPGEDLVVQVSGHWMGSCTAYDDRGDLVNDPMMLLNPLCPELLNPAP